jgi:hypothetical protein
MDVWPFPIGAFCAVGFTSFAAISALLALEANLIL